MPTVRADFSSTVPSSSPSEDGAFWTTFLRSMVGFGVEDGSELD
jgi:hypothetical protein